MTADKPSPFVPKLQFPEFAQGPGWDHATVADLVETVTPPKKLTTSTYLADGRFPIIDQSQSYICGWTNDDEAVITTPLPVIVFGDHTCVLKFVNRPFAQGADGIKILTARRRVSTLYLYHQLTYRPVVMEEYKRHFSALKDKVVCFPDKKSGEQQKIADCLGSLDDLIAADGRKLEALRQHKQGLMQQLFPQPGETVPRLRFPEFSEQGEWDETTIGNMGEVITGSTPSTSRRDFYGGDFMFVSPADISDLRFVEKTKTTLTEAGFAECRQIKENSVLFVCIGSTIGKVAQCSRLCATNQQINSLVASSAFVEDFAYYLLDNESVRIASLAGKQAVPIIKKSLFAAVKVTAPAIPEQQRIADCLSSLDAQLAAQVQKLNALKTHKRGLLQQLFP